MKMIGLLCGIAAVMALSGCSGMGVQGEKGAQIMPASTFRCTLNDDCMVTVSVVETGSSSCTITIDPAIDIELNSNHLSQFVSHLLRWVLDDEAQDMKFRFDKETGVALKAADTTGQFFDPKWKSKGREFQWRDWNRNNRYYDYTINIVQKNSSRKCSLDPRIWNN